MSILLKRTFECPCFGFEEIHAIWGPHPTPMNRLFETDMRGRDTPARIMRASNSTLWCAREYAIASVFGLKTQIFD